MLYMCNGVSFYMNLSFITVSTLYKEHQVNFMCSCYRNTIALFFKPLLRERFCAVQYKAAEQDLPQWPQDRLLQLQPTGHVEFGLSDR